jgi:type II secretory ATPase GspE/PulE/Tfp pilus assembly ATPase PilB-like protein
MGFFSDLDQATPGNRGGLLGKLLRSPSTAFSESGPTAEPQFRAVGPQMRTTADTLDSGNVADVDFTWTAPEKIGAEPWVEQAGATVKIPGSSGVPVLTSVDALGAFKRVLTSSTGGAAVLTVSPSVGKQFVAVDVQAGVAIAIATAAFRETAQYATFLKDLELAHVSVREEMVASEAVIASVYDAERSMRAGTSSDAPRAISTFRDIVDAAHGYSATDIHIQCRDHEKDAEIRFRINTDLVTWKRLPKQSVMQALGAAYGDLVQKNTNSGVSFQPSEPQSAMIPIVSGADIVNLRWQSVAAASEFAVALRLLDGNFKNYKVRLPKEMGYEASQLQIIESLSNASGGLTIVSGETGAGKTTLLRALSFLVADREAKRQFAVNEPSEYPMPWLTDVSIQRKPDDLDSEINRKYAEVLRTFMRMDPNDLTVGEIRDAIVASIAIEFARTGHPVRTSIHGDSVMDVYMRLAGGRLAIPIEDLASRKLINAVLNQKLVPKLCSCAKPAEEVMSTQHLNLLQRKFGLDTAPMRCRDHDGCELCRLDGLATRFAGTIGQLVVAEIYCPTKPFLKRVRERDWLGAEEVWRGERLTGFEDQDMTGKTAFEHALYKASKGQIDPRVIHENMEPFDRYEIFDSKAPTL